MSDLNDENLCHNTTPTNNFRIDNNLRINGNPDFYMKFRDFKIERE